MTKLCTCTYKGWRGSGGIKKTEFSFTRFGIVSGLLLVSGIIVIMGVQ